MGASLAMAGSAGCFRRPREKIHTYLEQPEELIGSETLSYATSLAWRGYGRGLLATSYQGRPIKLDGNPDHASTGHASDPVMQAAVLDLYDQSRLRAPRRNDRQTSWKTFRNTLADRLRRHRNQGGAGLWIVAEPTTSPTENALWKEITEAWPGARFVLHRPASELHFPPVDHRFAEADVILGVGADFLSEHPESLRYSRDFTARRRGWKDDGKTLSRFFSLHAAPNITTTMADAPCPIDPQHWAAVLEAIEAGIHSGNTLVDGLPPGTQAWAGSAVEALRTSAGRSLVIAGSTEPAAVHAWAERLNSTLGNHGQTVLPLQPPPLTPEVLPAASRASLAELADALDAGAVENLIMLDANPVFTAPHLQLQERLRDVPWSVSAAAAPNETGRLCHWQLPLHHFLEDWGDLRSFTGKASPVQPLIHPLYGSASRLELLNWLVRPDDRSDAHQLVQSYWENRYDSAVFPMVWREALSKGVFPPVSQTPESTATRPSTGSPDLREALGAPGPQHESGTFNLELRLDPSLEDGRHARNGWLQELPKPLSKLVWDSALWVAPETLTAQGWISGELIEIATDENTIQLPAFPLPGVAPGTVVGFLGYGRRDARLHEDQHMGFDAFPLWRGEYPWRVPGVQLRSTGKHHALVSVQAHRQMEGHDFVRVRETGTQALPHHAPDPVETSFYSAPPNAADEPSPYQWGMSIDLSSCTGCSACVLACQAENNIPVVGKEEVAKGREMQWLWIDQYIDDSRHHPHVLHQPRLCMHCEKAPCEVVCPVAATLHDSEGLNLMIYNRCIGTRYCSNNCPYKVRCFNFFEYGPGEDDPRNLQFNPEVTVRERGVMEKCTFCVQRISAARISAKSTDGTIPVDGVRTACQEACPTEAIVFGNVADGRWHVTERKGMEGDYALLGELDTRPRVTYLPKWRHPAT